MLAVKQQADIEMISCLLEHNAEINQLNYNNGYNALTFAILRKNKELVKELIARGANVNLQDTLGLTALFHTVLSEDLAIIELLLRKCANVSQADNLGSTVAHIVA